MKKFYIFKCGICGKYIKRDDFKEGKVVTNYTPSSAYSYELIEHFHRRCHAKKDDH